METTKSIKWNAIANFIGLGYSTIIGIVVWPFYLHSLGSEAFGLVGFFTVLQAWMQLFDMGMSPMLSRQAAYARGQHIKIIEFKKLLRSLELTVFFISTIVVSGIVTNSTWIATNWLDITSLNVNSVTICLILMSIIIGIGFFSSLYRSGIRGMEKQVSLNVANMILITLKFVGAALVLRFITQGLIFFFIYQTLVAIVELLVLCSILYRSIPIAKKIGMKFFWGSLKPMLPFAGGIAYTAGIWVLLTQLDKLILSRVLPLSEFGYFSLVTVVSTGIMQITSPISQAILPRMTYLLSQGKKQHMHELYRQATQFIAVLIFPIAGTIAFFPYEFLFAWTGDRVAAEWAAPILVWFTLGNCLLALSAFQYYLQFAHGNLKLHVIYNSVSACIQIPVLIYTAFQYGATGVALIWFVMRAFSFIIWTPIVHHKFAPGIHWLWLSKDIAPALLNTTVLLLLVNYTGINFEGMGRIKIFLLLAGLGAIILTVNMLVSTVSRRFIVATVQKGKELFRAG